MRVKFTDFPSEFKKLNKSLIKTFISIGSKGNYILGKELEVFENEVEKFLSVKHALGVGNWTDGAIMLFKALNLKKSDEIITVSNSFIASVGSIAYYGSKPVLVDIGEDLNIDEKLIQKKITKNTKAIMPVHLSGIPSNLKIIKKICKKNNLLLIEDAAHSFGSKYDNKYLGTLGDVGIFSLHPRKIFHVFGDGGLIITNNTKLYKKLKLLRNHGLKSRDESVLWGTNSRLDNLQAAFGSIMLKNIKSWNKKHHEIAKTYENNLSNLVKVPKYNKKSIPTFHQYIIRTRYRDELKNFLKKKGIETAIHYPIPIHLQKSYLKSFGKIKLPKTESASKEILSLPIYNMLSKKKLFYVINSIKAFFKMKKLKSL